MGLSRFFRRWAPVPEWASFFNRAQYCRFIDLVNADFERRGQEASIVDGVVNVEGGDNSFGLLNVAQICKQLPPDDWCDVIAGHFDNIYRSEVEREQLEAEVDDLTCVVEHLGLRLYPEDFCDNDAGRASVSFNDIPGTVSVLVIDMPNSVATVPEEQLQTWQQDAQQLRKKAMANLDSLADGTVDSVDFGDDCQASVLLGDSLFTASWALNLEQRLPDCACEHGALIGIPHRHALIAFPIQDRRVLTAINTMIPMVAGMYQEGPGSISPRLYWYRDGSYTDLPYDIGETEINFLPPPEFMAMVEALLE